MLENKKIILASASPRRKELLHQLGLIFTIEPAAGNETVSPGLSPEQIVQTLAYEKANEIRDKQRDMRSVLIIGADTIVVKDGSVLGKPKNEEDAVHMLRKLSDTTHQVYTGVAVLTSEWEVRFSEKTDVTFYPMSEQEILAYVESKEPMDKAGAYGIQGIGGRFVKEIRGDYNSVVGLPIARLYQVLKELPVS